MDKCLNCQKELQHVLGRKKKRYCNETCRSNHWYGKNKKGKTKTPVAAVPAKKKVTPKIKVADLTQPTGQKKPQEQPKTNFSVNTTQEGGGSKIASNPFRDEYRKKKLGL